MELKKKRAGGDETRRRRTRLRSAVAPVLSYLAPSPLPPPPSSASTSPPLPSPRLRRRPQPRAPPYPFLNAVDSRRYSYFLYTPTSVLHSSAHAPQPWGPESEPRPLRPSTKSASFLVLSGCGCEGLGSIGDDGDCLCLSECGEDCGCGIDCGNRRTQCGVAVRLKIVMGRDKWWGLHAAQLIWKGEFICEYAGELLTIPLYVNFSLLKKQEDSRLYTINSSPRTMFLHF